MVPMLNAAAQPAMQTAGASPAAVASERPNPGAPTPFDKVLSGAYGEQASSAAPTQSQASGSATGQTPVPRNATRRGAPAASPMAPYVAIPVTAQTQVGIPAQHAQQNDSNAESFTGARDQVAIGGLAAADLLSGGEFAAAMPGGTPAQSGIASIPGAASSDGILSAQSREQGAAGTATDGDPRGVQTSSESAARAQDAAEPGSHQPSTAAEGNVWPPDWSWLQSPEVQTFPAAAEAPRGASSKAVVDGHSSASSGIGQPNSNSGVGTAGVESSAEFLSVARSQQPQQARDSEGKSISGASTTGMDDGAPRIQLLPVQPVVEPQNLATGSAGSSRGTTQAVAAGSGKQVVAAPQASGADHAGADTPGKDGNPSNSDSAAAQTAGLAQAAVGGPLHAPAVATASAEAPAGPAAASLTAQPAAAQPSLAPATTPMTPRAAPLPAPAPSSTNDFVQASQLYQRVGGAEMHVEMSTELLGSVDVHAVVRQSTVSATIGVQRPEVQTLLASDLPALQHALSEHSLHVEQISVLGGSTGGQTDLSRHAPQNQQKWPMPGGGFAMANAGSETTPNSGIEMVGAAMSQAAVAAGRLNIHA